MTAIGTRRPREGRCERCDRPLTGEVYEHFEAYGADGREVRATDPEWLALVPTGDGECEGDKHVCRGPSVDWRARALAAEAALQDAEARGRQHGLLAAAIRCDAEVEWCEREIARARVERSPVGVMRGEDRQLAMLAILDEIMALAAEATDGR